MAIEHTVQGNMAVAGEFMPRNQEVILIRNISI
jgi:hypothetical protein